MRLDMSVPVDLVKGFLATWRNRPRGEMQVRLNLEAGEPLGIDLQAFEQSRAADLAQFLAENLSRAQCLFEGLLHDPSATSLLANHLSEPPASFNRARGHIETARGIEGVGGLILGWTVSEPGVRFHLVDDRGDVVSLGDAARWTRNDIVDAMSVRFRRLRLQRRLPSEVERAL